MKLDTAITFQKAINWIFLIPVIIVGFLSCLTFFVMFMDLFFEGYIEYVKIFTISGIVLTIIIIIGIILGKYNERLIRDSRWWWERKRDKKYSKEDAEEKLEKINVAKKLSLENFKKGIYIRMAWEGITSNDITIPDDLAKEFQEYVLNQEEKLKPRTQDSSSDNIEMTKTLLRINKRFKCNEPTKL